MIAANLRLKALQCAARRLMNSARMNTAMRSSLGSFTSLVSKTINNFSASMLVCPSTNPPKAPLLVYKESPRANICKRSRCNGSTSSAAACAVTLARSDIIGTLPRKCASMYATRIKPSRSDFSSTFNSSRPSGASIRSNKESRELILSADGSPALRFSMLASSIWSSGLRSKGLIMLPEFGPKSM